MRRVGIQFVVAALAASRLVAADRVGPPPRELVADWKLSSVYAKHLSVEGFPVLSSVKVSDAALAEAAFLVRQMIGHRPEVLRALTTNRVRLAVMATSEMTTDVPEHSDLTPKSYWDRRARGLGATKQRPAVSCGEENLLDLPGDPYAAENILLHEFAHAIHEMGMVLVDPTFDPRLQRAYDHAKTKGLWRDTYASVNRMEYWAEAAQSWFNCNRANDREHGDIDTREKLKACDPEVAVLLAEVFGDRPWRYRKPSKRPGEERKHLAEFDVSKAPRFVWPKQVPVLEKQGVALTWIEPAKAPSASPRGSTETSILFVNRRPRAVEVEWIAFDGSRKRYATVRPGSPHLQATYTGHAWLVVENNQPLGAVVAGDSAGRAEIK